MSKCSSGGGERGSHGSTGVVREKGRIYWLERQGENAGYLVSSLNRANGGVKGERVGYRVDSDEPAVPECDIRSDRLYFLSGTTGEEISVGWVEAKRSVKGETVGPAQTCSTKRKSACKRSRHCDWEDGEGCRIAPSAEGAVKGGPNRAAFVAAVHAGQSPLRVVGGSSVKKARRCSPAKALPKKTALASPKKAASPAKKRCTSPKRRSASPKSQSSSVVDIAETSSSAACRSPITFRASRARPISAIIADTAANSARIRRVTPSIENTGASVSASVAANKTPSVVSKEKMLCADEATIAPPRRTSARIRALAAARR